MSVRQLNQFILSYLETLRLVALNNATAQGLKSNIIPALADVLGRKYGLAICGVVMLTGAILKSSSFYVS